jgi:hypothetical protein
VSFVLKPHPHEERGDYEAFVADCRAEGLDNVALVTEEYIWDILNSASVHVHRLCTTGIEAWLMGVPSINFHTESYGGWSLDQEGPAKEALDGDDLATDEKDLAERVEHYLSGGMVDAQKRAVHERYVRRWFYRIDGLAARRCAEAIADHLETTHRRPVFAPWVFGARPLIKGAVNVLRRRPLHAPLRVPRRIVGGVTVDALGQRDKDVRAEDVAGWSRRIRAAAAEPVGS